MKTRTLFLVLFTLSMSLNLHSQEKAGCDLCGPTSGTAQNIASGNYSATIGAACETKGAYSLAVGNASKANAGNTLALGKFVRANATNAVVIGSGTSDSDSRALVNNKPNTMMIGFNSIFPTIFVTASTAYNTTGKVAIGNITTPKSKLHIKSDSNEDVGIILEPTTISSSAYLQIFDDNHRISVSKGKGMSVLSQNDNINFEAKQIDMNAKLTVSGGILANEVLIKEVSEWYDFVFDDDYELISLSELESFINKNGHLPDMPSEKSVVNNGYNMVEMDGLLLKKIEELTLYAIELSKIVEKQQHIIELLNNN